MNDFTRTLSYQTADATGGATFSMCQQYRYLLWRRWDPIKVPVKWIMLNPSKADASRDDPTIRKCIKFAKAWGYGGIRVVNLFAYRSTDPKALKKLGYAEAVGEANNYFILNALRSAGPNICAWGQAGKLWSRDQVVLSWCAEEQGLLPKALKLSKDGTPYHPLYLRDNSQPFEL